VHRSGFLSITAPSRTEYAGGHLSYGRYRAVMRPWNKMVTILEAHYGIIGAASSSAFHDRLSTGPTSVGEDAITLRMLALSEYGRSAPQ